MPLFLFLPGFSRQTGLHHGLRQVLQPGFLHQTGLIPQGYLPSTGGERRCGLGATFFKSPDFVLSCWAEWSCHLPILHFQSRCLQLYLLCGGVCVFFGTVFQTRGLLENITRQCGLPWRFTRSELRERAMLHFNRTKIQYLIELHYRQ